MQCSNYVIVFSNFIFLLPFYIFLIFSCNSASHKLNVDSSNVKSVNILEEVKIGNVNQWLLSRGDDVNKPLLLIIHGGPGAASIGFARSFYKELEKHFIVVNWDQRGSGKSFTFFMDDVSPDTFVYDTIEVIDYLKTKFHKNKVYLMGHSWGGYISALVAHKHPEKLISLILIGPVIKSKSSLDLSFKFVTSNRYDDPEVQKRVTNLTFKEYFDNRRYWLNLNCVGMFHGKECHSENSYLSGIMFDSPEYNLINILTYLPGIWKTSSRIRPYFLEMNLFSSVQELKMPVHIIIGRYDYYNPISIAEEYLSVLKSPQKTLTILEGLAHAPHFENPDLFSEKILKVTSGE